MAYGYYLGGPAYYDEAGKLTLTGYPDGLPARKMAGTCLYIDDLGQAWMASLTKPGRFEVIDMQEPPRRAPDNWRDFVKPTSAQWEVLPPPEGWSPHQTPTE